MLLAVLQNVFFRLVFTILSITILIEERNQQFVDLWICITEYRLVNERFSTKCSFFFCNVYFLDGRVPFKGRGKSEISGHHIANNLEQYRHLSLMPPCMCASSRILCGHLRRT